MTSIWQMVQLGDVLKAVSRPEAVKPENRYRLLGAHWYAGGLYIKDVRTGSEIQADKVYRVKQGDFVYNRLFAWKGSFALATADVDGCYVSNEFPCFEINSERVVPEYLRWYFCRPLIWNKALGLSTGGTPTSRNRLKEDKLLSLRIHLPGLAEQRMVADRIDILAAKINQVHMLYAEAAKEIASLAAALHLELAQSRVVRLSDILKLDECREDVKFGQRYPQVGVKGFGQGLFEKGAVEASQTTYRAFNRLYDGAVVLSQVKGWEGAIAVCRSSLAGKYVSPEYRTFRCNPEGAKPEYLAGLFATPWFWSQLKYLTRGVGGRRERIRPEQFLGIELPMPTIDRQGQAVALFEKLAVIKQLQTQMYPEVDVLLLSIVSKAFRGEM